MKCYKSAMNGGCGVTVFDDFGTYDPWREKKIIEDDIPSEDSGAGWGIAAFVDTQPCREAYEAICSKYPIIFQSPVRENQNTNNNFFFVVFDLYSELPSIDSSWGF